MEDTTQYYKDPPKLIYELMQDTLGDRFTYFLGSPLALSQAVYPCVVIQPTDSSNSVTEAYTGQDYVTEKINIHIMFLDSMQAVASGNIDTVMRALYNIVQGRDPATGFYMTDTVLYALRTNLEIDNPTTKQPTVIDHDISVNYDVSPSGEKAIVEAIITVNTIERVNVPNRIV